MNSAFAAKTVFAKAKPRTRALLLLSLLFEVAARLLVVATAAAAVEGTALPAIALAAASALLFGALRASLAIARVAVERDIYGAAADAVLAGDVLELEDDDLRRVVLDGTHHGTMLIAQELPSLAGDVIAFALVAPFLASALPARVLVLAAVAVAVTMAAGALARRRARRVEQEEADAYARVHKTLVATVESRLEIVARAGEGTHGDEFRRELDGYASIVRRSGLLRAFFGRAPLAAGALVVAAAVLLDGGARVALGDAAVGHAIVLAAVYPTVRGAALGLFGLHRSLVYVVPLAELLLRPARGESGGRRVEPPCVVRATDLSFGYVAGQELLRDVTFEWMPGTPLVVVGPNGAGKSTLLRLLLGLRTPTAGALTFDGIALADCDLRSLRAQTAYLPQRPYLGERWDSVESAIRTSGPSLERDAVLERVGLDRAILGRPLGALSAGQRQRVALARVLLRDAAMYLLDEPDADLDRDGISLVARLVRELSERGKLVAVAAHGSELRELSPAPLELRR